MVRKWFAAAVAACVLAAVGFAAEKPAVSGAKVGEWTMDAPAALALAKEAGKPVFLCFTGSDWCGWCKLMERKVFSTEQWQAYAKEKLVLVWLDFPKDKALVPEQLVEQNRKLSEQYSVSGYPTYVILSAQGKELGRLGADKEASPEQFIQSLEEVLVLDRLEQLLDAADYAEYQKTTEELAGVWQKISAWEAETRKQREAFRATFRALEQKRKTLTDKAIEVAKAGK